MTERPKDQPEESRAEEADILFPGSEVPLVDGEGIQRASATVYPFGVRAIKRCGKAIATMLTLLWNSGVNVTLTDDGKVKLTDRQREALFHVMVPTLITDGVGILQECTVFSSPKLSFDNLPHWCLADIAKAWFEESFSSEKKIQAWMDLFNAAVNRIGGKDGISDKVSSFLSPADTD